MALSLYDLNNDKATKGLVTTIQHGLMSAQDKDKLDRVESNANYYVHPLTHAAAEITGLAAIATSGSYNDLLDKPTGIGNADTVDNMHAIDFVQAAHVGSGGTVHAAVTTLENGFMTSADKIKLNGITPGAKLVQTSLINGNIKIDGNEIAVYTHPSMHGNITNSGAIGTTPNLPVFTTDNGLLITKTAADGRAALGLGSNDSPVFTSLTITNGLNVGDVTSTEISYLTNVTGDIQEQLDALYLDETSSLHILSLTTNKPIIDKGTIWTECINPINNDAWYRICYGNGVFVAITCDSGKVLRSHDGISWEVITTSFAPYGWSCICYGNGMFIAIYDYEVLRSYDGISWTSMTTLNNDYWQSICYGNNMFVAVAHQGINRLAYSYDGITWNYGTSNENIAFRSVCYGNNIFVATADCCAIAGKIATSADGINWIVQEVAAAYNRNWKDICYGNGMFIAIDYSTSAYDKLLVSYDGINWVRYSVPSAAALNSICYGDGIFVIVSSTLGEETPPTNNIIISNDGISWKIIEGPNTNDLNSVCYGNGIFVAVTFNSNTANTIIRSGYPLNNETKDLDIITRNIKLLGLTANTVPYLDVSKNLVSSNITPNELGSLSSITGNIQSRLSTLTSTDINLQNQINTKVSTLSNLGITVTAGEVNYLSGATENIQQQLDYILDNGMVDVRKILYHANQCANSSFEFFDISLKPYYWDTTGIVSEESNFDGDYSLLLTPTQIATQKAEVDGGLWDPTSWNWTSNTRFSFRAKVASGIGKIKVEVINGSGVTQNLSYRTYNDITKNWSTFSGVKFIEFTPGISWPDAFQTFTAQCSSGGLHRLRFTNTGSINVYLDTVTIEGDNNTNWPSLYNPGIKSNGAADINGHKLFMTNYDPGSVAKDGDVWIDIS